MVSSTQPVKMPVVQGPTSGQQPMTLLGTLATQCEPAEHVAGSSGLPPMKPHTVLACRGSSSWLARNASSAGDWSRGARGSIGAAVGNGQGTTSIVRACGNEDVCRGRAWPCTESAMDVRIRNAAAAAAGGRRNKASGDILARGIWIQSNSGYFQAQVLREWQTGAHSLHGCAPNGRPGRVMQMAKMREMDMQRRRVERDSSRKLLVRWLDRARASGAS